MFSIFQSTSIHNITQPTGTEKFVKPTLVVHPSAYDGALELAAMHMGFGSFSYSTQEVHFKCSKEIVKNSLVEACVPKPSFVQSLDCFQCFSPWIVFMLYKC